MVHTIRLLGAALAVLGLLGGAGCSTEPTFVGGEGGHGAGGASQGGNATASGGAPGEACTEDSDCDGEANLCSKPACSNGHCVIQNLPAGTTEGIAQNSGDCRKQACDGEGAVTSQHDDGDAPNDANDCTIDGCNAGTPTSTIAAEGAPCGVGLQCDDGGLCSGCTAAAQCGADLPCLQQVCFETKCYQQPVVEGGGDVPDPVEGDCQRTVCNGQGGTKSVNDPGDPASDDNLCTLDGCDQGSPTHIDIVPQNDDNPCTEDVCDPRTGATDHQPTNQGQGCGDCKVCNAGVCGSTCTGCDTCVGGQCQSSCSDCETCNGTTCVSNCPGCQACVNGVCQGGCGPCQTCDNGACVGGCNPCQQCDNGTCTGGCGPCQQCQGGSCIDLCGPCQTCNGGVCQNTCSACQTCSGGTCVSNCGPCEVCSGGTCQSQCGPCEICSGGTCQSQCGICQYCDGSTCQYDPCLCNPCCGDPCCTANLVAKAKAEADGVPFIPPPCD